MEVHVTYRCVTGTGAPGGWKADPDCSQSVFPANIVYREKTAAAR